MTDLRQLEAAATPGPWKADRDDFGYYIAKADLAQPDYGADKAMPSHVGVETTLVGNAEANFAAVAALRNAAPFLLDVVDAVRAWCFSSDVSEDTAADMEQRMIRALEALDAHLEKS